MSLPHSSTPHSSAPRRVAVIKALAHPTRLRIVELLSVAPRCVSEIRAEVGGDLSTVSKHLSVMRQAGWVNCEKHGLQNRYQIACSCLNAFLCCVDSLAAVGDNKEANHCETYD